MRMWCDFLQESAHLLGFLSYALLAYFSSKRFQQLTHFSEYSLSGEVKTQTSFLQQRKPHHLSDHTGGARGPFERQTEVFHFLAVYQHRASAFSLQHWWSWLPLVGSPRVFSVPASLHRDTHLPWVPCPGAENQFHSLSRCSKLTQIANLLWWWCLV